MAQATGSTGSGLWTRLSVNVSPTRLAAFRRLVKYASVSVISTVTSLTVLALLTGALGFNAVVANIIAVGVGTVPSFELNRRWVWSQPRHGARATQIVPFCLLSFSGLVISSVAVQLAAEATAGQGRLWHTAAVEMANIGSYGVLWLVQYFLCAQLLFKAGGSQVALRPGSQRLQGGAVESLVTGRTAIGANNEPKANPSQASTADACSGQPAPPAGYGHHCTGFDHGRRRRRDGGGGRDTGDSVGRNGGCLFD